MLKPRDAEDAPNHEDLAKGWMSATEYWGLNKDKPRSAEVTSVKDAKEAKSSKRKRPSMSAREYYGSRGKAA